LDSVLSTAVYALSSAFSWGAGDFTAGLAARHTGPFRSIFLSYIVGLFSLVLAAVGFSERIPAAIDLLWGMVAGTIGMLGLGFLLRGFTTGSMGIVAPLSAVLATIVPVAFTSLTVSLPQVVQLVGFGLAMISIWLLSRPEKLGKRPEGLGMGLLAGLCFGGFFIALDQIAAESVFWPLAMGRLSSLVLMLVFSIWTRRSLIAPSLPYRYLVLAGFLDVGGNIFFLLAAQSGRLDVTAVLASLYPAITAILASIINKEHLARMQQIGVGAAVLSIALITL
jgi:drug/metabolite transporter (DMT)-like permease